MKSDGKLYLVMSGAFWDDHAHPLSVYKSRLVAESVARCIEEDKDDDGYANSYAYVTEIDFYDQDA